MIGLSHAEDVAHRASRAVADDYQAAPQQAVANDSRLAIILPFVIDLNGRARENYRGIIEVQPSIGKRTCALDRIIGDAHRLLYLQ